MRGRLLGLLLAAAVSFPATAAAAPVLVMGRDGHVHRAIDRFLPSVAPVPAPAPPPRAAVRASRTGAVVARAKPKPQPKPKRPTVTSELSRLYRTGQITSSTYSSYSGSWSAATARPSACTALGRRAGRGDGQPQGDGRRPRLHPLAPARAVPDPGPQPPVVDHRAVPYSGQEIEFTGSNLVWEYYPGRDSSSRCWPRSARPTACTPPAPPSIRSCSALLAEMIPLAAVRAGGWPGSTTSTSTAAPRPGSSAMAQGTAIEALTRAAKAFGPPTGASRQLATATSRSPSRRWRCSPPPPRRGTRIGTPPGARYLQYSFAPHTDIINAFLQSLIGLYDYAQTSRNPRPSGCLRPATPRPRPSCRTSTPAPGRCISPGSRTT